MILFETICIKISQIVTIFPHNGKLPDFSYKLPHFIFSDVISIFIFPPKAPEHCIEKKIKFCNFWNRSSYRNNCFWILEQFSIIYQERFERSSILTPIQGDGAHILVHILRVLSLDSARNLHVPYICFVTYSSCFGKSARYAVQRCVRTSLALVHRHLIVIDARLSSLASLFLRFICPRAPYVTWVFFFGDPYRLPNIIFVYRIVLFYLRYLPQMEKSPENLLQGDKQRSS